MSSACVASIGNFDGVHLGHRAILRAARALADQRGLPLRVFTFDPPPVQVLRPQLAPPRLSTLRQRIALLQQHGADDVHVFEPTPQLLGMEPIAFLQQLITQHHPVALVEGANFRFGKDRRGDVQLLQDQGQSLGVQTHVVQAAQVTLHDHLITDVSSTLVRYLVGQGRVADAWLCLGRPYSLTATVAHGEQRGRKLNMPTANLDLSPMPQVLVPGDGVYAGAAQLENGDTHAAAISIGIKPTFGKDRLTVEAHLLDFDGDIYGQTITLSFTSWLRGQQRFPDFAALAAQLQRDVAGVHELHQANLIAQPLRTQMQSSS